MQIKQIIIHHTVSDRDSTTLEEINRWHRARWPGFKSSVGYYVGYHYVILADGSRIQTRRDDEMGAHAIPNDGRIGICLAGNFEVETPTRRQLDALTSILIQLKIKYPQITDYTIFGHQEVGKTLCPGKNLQKWIKEYRQISLLQKLINELKSKIEAFLKGRGR